MLKKGDKKLINAWAFYDWANSVYSLVIGTAVFPLYYSNITEGATVSFLGTDMGTSRHFIFLCLILFILSGCFYVTNSFSYC